MVNLKLALHFFGYGGLFGITCYQSFFAGIVAYRAIPERMFSQLQRKIFPGYFLMQTVLLTLLCLTPPFKLNALAGISLVVSLIGSFLNYTIIGSRVHRIIIEREKQMDKEGKSHKDPTVSDDMKKLNAEFKTAHSISMVLNLLLIAGVFYYGYYFLTQISP